MFWENFTTLCDLNNISPNAVAKTIGENIKLARMQAGISRAKLAEELCVSEVMVYKYETDSANVHPRKLKKIAEVCGVSVEELTAIGA